MQLQEFTNSLNTFLESDRVQDYCPNGLQVESRNQKIEQVALAVTASLEAIEKAAQVGAKVLVVNHGYFWKN